MEDYISKLKQFSEMNFNSKQAVINKGRPTPDLKELLQITGHNTRSFNKEWYAQKSWLCGCPVRNRLFCFPCLLFSTCENAWTQWGYCDLKNLQRGLTQHERSTIHIHSQISLKTFGTSTINSALDEQRLLNTSVHNAEVRENREILKDYVNAICFLAKRELACYGNYGSMRSTNWSNYAELLHAFAENDYRLARRLRSSTVFSGLTNEMQKDLIEAVADVIKNDIKKEVHAAPFVAVEVDETTDVTNQAHISLILRYVVSTEEGCKVKEAFLGSDDLVDNDRHASTIGAYVLHVLEEYDCVDKVVAQTYDGSVVMASELNDMQAKIEEKVPEAMLTHCYAHNLNSVLLHSAKCMPECRTFVKTALGLKSFFNKSTKRVRLLDNVVKCSLPTAPSTRWNCNSKLMQTISMHHNDLLAFFQIIIENPDDWDIDTLMMATGYSQWLSKTATCFLLMAYESIFNETGNLFQILQNRMMDIEYCFVRICGTITALEHVRCEFDSFYDRFENKCNALGLAESGDREFIKEERKQLFCNILDNVDHQMKARFENFDELAFVGLVDSVKFSQMIRNFDDTKVWSLSKFAKYFDIARLKSDLLGLYSSEIVRNQCKCPKDILTFLIQNNLIETVPEATKLLQLVLTIPLITASRERSFSALKRLETCSENLTEQGQPFSYILISVEAERLLKLKDNRDKFYDQVIEAFLQKKQCMDFIYK